GSPLIPALVSRRKMGLKVWKLDGGAVVFNPSDVGASGAFSPDGRFLLAYKRYTSVRLSPRTPELLGSLWRTSDWTELRTFGPAESWSFDGTGRLLALAGSTSPEHKPFYRVEEVESGKQVALGHPEFTPGDIALSPDGSTLAVARHLRTEFDL